MQKEYQSYDQITSQVQELVYQITTSGWTPTIIVGICRGGLLPATLLSHSLQVPMKAFNLSLRDQNMFLPDSADWIAHIAQDNPRVLVVDDINDSGSTISWLNQDWGRRWKLSGAQGLFKNHFKFAVLINKETSIQKADFAAHQVDRSQDHVWWVFPWERGA